MYGEAEGVPVTVFDYNFGRKWVKGQGTLRKQTVAMVQSDKLNLPAFFLRPANFRHKLGTVFSASISFPAQAAFSNQYLLSGNDETGVRQLSNDSALSFFEANPGWSTEGGGGQLFIYREDTLMPPQNIPWFVNEGSPSAEAASEHATGFRVGLMRTVMATSGDLYKPRA
jgi:hypothetical protein